MAIQDSSLKTLAFCPIDLPKLEIDCSLVESLISKFGTDHHEGLWRCLPLMGIVDSQNDFLSALKFEQAWDRRYNSHGKVEINSKLKNPLKSLYQQLSLLPMRPTHCQILNQVKEVGKHFDLKHVENKFIDDCPGLNDELEPANYKILLNQTNKESFFVSRKFGDKNQFVRLPDSTNTFVVNEKRYPHGAKLLHEPKYIVSIFGILDPKRHLNLVNHSLQKFNNFAISFE